MIIAIFLALSPLFASPLDGVWTALARGSHDVFIQNCDDLPGLDAKCSPVHDGQKDVVNVSEALYLSELARMRSAGDGCTAGEIGRVLGDATAFAEVMTKVKASLAELRSIETSRDAARVDGDDAKARQLEALADTVSAGIPYATHPAVKAFLRRAAQTSSAVKNDDEGGLRAALAAAQTDAQKSKIRLDQMASGDRPFQLATKESLTQDADLVASYFAKDPDRRVKARAAACAADREYGRGAVARNRALPAVGAALTAALVPQGKLAGRALAGEALGGLRAAALARNILAAQSTTRVLSAAATFVDLAAGARAIDQECFGSHFGAAAAVKPDFVCEKADAKTLAATTCAQSAVMTLIAGSAAASPLIKQLVNEWTLARGAVDSSKALARLEAKAQAFSAPKEIPGGAGGPIGAGLQNGRFLRTSEIRAGDLPYASSLRPPQPTGGAVTQLAPGSVKRTDVIFASGEHSGSAGVVRLGEFNGRPVAIKSYPNHENKFLMKEADDSKLASDLGIGPQFHGVYKDADGHMNLVTDVVPGDFKGMPVTTQTFEDLKTIETRLRAAGVKSAGDFQPYHTPDGRLLVIDANFGRSMSSPLADRLEVDLSGEYLGLLREAPADVARAQIENLRRTNPDMLERAIDRVHMWIDRRLPMSQPVLDLAH